jgi:alpha-glucoside transport system permease protein
MTDAVLKDQSPAERQAAAQRDLPAVKKIRKSFSSPLASMFMVVLTVLWTLPTFGLLVTSLRPAKDVNNTGWWSVFAHPALTLDNYQTILFHNSFGSSGGLIPFFVNSLAITIPGTIFPLVIAAMAAYALAWVRFKGSDFLFFLIFALQVVPLQMALIPLLKIYNSLGLSAGQSYAPVWLSHTMFAMPLAIFLLHNFIAQLPKDVMEAAQVDGANHFKTFRSIVLPLAAPALASFAIFQFLWVWNDLLVALTFTSGDATVSPLMVRLVQLSGSFGRNWELLTAGAFVSMIIPLVVFFSLQRYFVRGLLAGSVKG